MKTRFIVALVLVLSGLPGDQAWGQRFRFIPIPRPTPFRWPVHSPVHFPIHPPTSFPQSTDPSPPNQPSGKSAAETNKDMAAFLLVPLGIGLAALLMASIGIVTGADNIALLKILVAPVIGLLKLLVAPG